MARLLVVGGDGLAAGGRGRHWLGYRVQVGPPGGHIGGQLGQAVLGIARAAPGIICARPHGSLYSSKPRRTLAKDVDSSLLHVLRPCLSQVPREMPSCVRLLAGACRLTCQVETSLAILDRLFLASAAPPMICTRQNTLIIQQSILM